MAITRVLTDWVTVQGNGTAVRGATQPEDQYLEILGATDLVLYTVLISGTANGMLFFETAPERDEALFVATLSGSIGGEGGFPVKATPTVKIVQYAAGTSSHPAGSRWLRWRVGGYSVAWSVTMRIIVALNPSDYAPLLVFGCVGLDCGSVKADTSASST